MASSIKKKRDRASGPSFQLASFSLEWVGRPVIDLLLLFFWLLQLRIANGEGSNRLQPWRSVDPAGSQRLVSLSFQAAVDGSDIFLIGLQISADGASAARD